MILVNENISFIQHAEIDRSWRGKMKCEIGGRITSLGTSLALLAEGISRTALSLLAKLGSLASFGLWKQGAVWTTEHSEKAQAALILSLKCLMGVLSPKSLHDQLIEGPLKGEVRENRLRIGAELIQGKLREELRSAQNQMLREEDGEHFQYLDGNLGNVGSERIGEYEVGFCDYIGRRPTMEDEHLAVSFDLLINKARYPIRLFGIFDGHGGTEAARFLKERLQAKLEKTLIEMNPNGLTDEGIWNALKLTFVQLNKEFSGDSGSTATVCLTLDGKLWTANVGDSRTILSNGGEVLQLSEDAKPADPKYTKGIENRSGVVLWNQGMRVNGNLAVARSLGDHSLNGAISARPKITMIPLETIRPGSDLVMACDGIYDVASSQQIGRAMRDNEAETPETRARKIVFSAFEAQSTDNLSAMVIRIR